MKRSLILCTLVVFFLGSADAFAKSKKGHSHKSSASAVKTHKKKAKHVGSHKAKKSSRTTASKWFPEGH